MSNLLTISYGDTKESAVALEAVLKLMADNGAVFEIETVQLGAEMEKLGFEKGFDEEAVQKIRRTRTLLKAPTEKNITPDLQAALGDECMIFEATTAEGMLKTAIDMLRHLQQNEIADLIQK